MKNSFSSRFLAVPFTVCTRDHKKRLKIGPALSQQNGTRQGLLVDYLKSLPLRLSRVRDCAAEARPADETAEAEQGQRSVFCEGAATPEAKAGHHNQTCQRS